MEVLVVLAGFAQLLPQLVAAAHLKLLYLSQAGLDIQ
jgi:hypothetical protein